MSLFVFMLFHRNSAAPEIFPPHHFPNFYHFPMYPTIWPFVAKRFDFFVNVRGRDLVRIQLSGRQLVKF